MKRNFLLNSKGQFFIAIAVIVIFTLSAIFYYFSTVNYSTDVPLRHKDMSFFANNAKEEFHKVAELTLANISAYNGSNPVTVNPTNAFNSNLSSFSKYIQAIAIQNGIIMNVSYLIGHATNTSVNASVNLTLSSDSGVFSTAFSAFSNISVKIVSGTLLKGPNLCTFNVSVTKEYGEPVTNMTARHFGVLVNGTNCAAATFTEKEVGIYNFSCTNTVGGKSDCVSSSLVANVTDPRNIVGWDAKPNTGLGYQP